MALACPVVVIDRDRDVEARLLETRSRPPAPDHKLAHSGRLPFSIRSRQRDMSLRLSLLTLGSSSLACPSDSGQRIRIRLGADRVGPPLPSGADSREALLTARTLRARGTIGQTWPTAGNGPSRIPLNRSGSSRYST